MVLATSVWYLTRGTKSNRYQHRYIPTYESEQCDKSYSGMLKSISCYTCIFLLRYIHDSWPLQDLWGRSRRSRSRHLVGTRNPSYPPSHESALNRRQPTTTNHTFYSISCLENNKTKFQDAYDANVTSWHMDKSLRVQVGSAQITRLKLSDQCKCCIFVFTYIYNYPF